MGRELVLVSYTVEEVDYSGKKTGCPSEIWLLGYKLLKNVTGHGRTARVGSGKWGQVR